MLCGAGVCCLHNAHQRVPPPRPPPPPSRKVMHDLVSTTHFALAHLNTLALKFTNVSDVGVNFFYACHCGLPCAHCSAVVCVMRPCLCHTTTGCRSARVQGLS